MTISEGATALPESAVQSLKRLNPWWEGRRGPVPPPHRRHLVAQIHRRLDANLAPIVAVRGARQIGKSTSQLQVLSDLLARGVSPKRIFRVQFDEIPELLRLESPILRLVDWFEACVLGKTLNEAAWQEEPAYLFFDEAQNLPYWAPQLKFLVDCTTVRVVLTGSSALRIELGRDSLAGRLSTIEAGVLSLTEIAALRELGPLDPFLVDNGLALLMKVDFWRDLVRHGVVHRTIRDASFAAFSERGGYPLGHVNSEMPWPILADQLNENVIRRVIEHDLRLGDRGRKRDGVLLEALFRTLCRYAGQCPALNTLGNEVRRALDREIADVRIGHYLRFLADTLLVRLVEPLEIRLRRQRSAPKVCLVDPALRASWLQEVVPLDPAALARHPELAPLAGHIAESVVGATLTAITGLDVNHNPARPEEPEIDFVLTIGYQRIPIEVKYQATVDPVRDSAALRAFIAREPNHAPFGLLVTRTDIAGPVPDGIVVLPLSSFMLLR